MTGGHGGSSGFVCDWCSVRHLCDGAPSGLCLTGGPGFVCDWCSVRLLCD